MSIGAGNWKSNPVVILGCFDTKGEDFAFLRELLVSGGHRVYTVNVGIRGTTLLFPVDVEADEVAGAAGCSLVDLRSRGDRGAAVEEMGVGASEILRRLVDNGSVAGVIGMGGGGGTHIVLKAMQAVPFGIPKVCLSTLATHDLSRQVGSADIVLVPSVVDVAGLNSISRVTIGHAASAIGGMVNRRPHAAADSVMLGRIAVSMFGNTTECVDACIALLRGMGYEAIAFHANGAGGRTMESLIAAGYFDGVLDITTTELADELCGGVCSAGPERLTAAGGKGIPQVIVPGCLDMVNFWGMDSVPERYHGRQLYSWAPDITLMRTDVEENRMLGRLLADRVLASPLGTAVVLLPMDGLSQLDAPGGLFHSPETDRALFDSILSGVSGRAEVMEAPLHINDREFASLAVEALLGLLAKSASTRDRKSQ
ncbi:Tm-1-like ATP-binding domain-containing protein [Parapedobacter soli]|uniref:Tm-1-like ATP-binding domain-containing protein n=1 Tax=Parapedobacter soli TaxID=416955 RepID=UPI0021CADC41|nr:Tm-1-like ATP-binding domain-containing protein [Parapedobacter soli]